MTTFELLRGNAVDELCEEMGADGLLEVDVLRPGSSRRLAASAQVGIGLWLAGWAAAEKTDQPLLCIGCDERFGARPYTFARLRPDVLRRLAGNQNVIVFGICRACEHRDDDQLIEAVKNTAQLLRWQ